MCSTMRWVYKILTVLVAYKIWHLGLTNYVERQILNSIQLSNFQVCTDINMLPTKNEKKKKRNLGLRVSLPPTCCCSVGMTKQISLGPISHQQECL